MQVTPQLLGALTSLSWVCTLPSMAPPAKKEATTTTTTHSTHFTTTTIDHGVQVPLSTSSPQLHVLDSKEGDYELALLISSLPINLVVVKPDSPVKQDEYEGTRDGEETGRSNAPKLTAARKKTEWGPLISHCYSCYWRCVLFTLKQIHSRDKDSSCGGLLLAYGRRSETGRVSNIANTEAITSKSSSSSKGNNYFSPSNSKSESGSGSSLLSKGGGQSLIPVASNDLYALIEVCLSSGLDLADKEVPTVVHCLQLLLPQVYRHLCKCELCKLFCNKYYCVQ